MRTVTLATSLGVVALVYTCCCLDFKTSRDDLLHPDDEHRLAWERYSQEFDQESDIVVAVAGDDQREMVAALETIARDLEGYPHLFDKICYRLQFDRLRAKGLFHMSVDDLRQVADRVEKFRPLVLTGWEFLTLDRVIQHAVARLPRPESKKTLEAGQIDDLRGVGRMLESLAAYLENGQVYRSPWKGLVTERASHNARVPEYFFSDSGKMAFLRVHPLRDPSSFTALARPVAVLRHVVQRAQLAFPRLELGATGLPILEDDEMHAAKAASSRATILSFVGVALIFIVAFRSFLHPLCATYTLLVCSAWTLGWVTLTVGHLNILSVTFIVTLIGLGIDFGIMWVARFEARRHQYLSSRLTNLTTAREVGQSIFVGGLTTALAFFATMLAGFLGLRELGWIAGSGVLICLLGNFTLLPALLALRDNPVTPTITGAPSWNLGHGQRLQRLATSLSIVCLVSIVPLFWYATQVRFDHNLLNLQAEGLPSVEWEKRLVQEAKLSGWYAISLADSPEAAREMRLRYEKLDSVGRVVEIGSLLPQNQEKKLPLVQRIHSAVASLPERGRPHRMDERALQVLTAQLTTLANREGTRDQHDGRLLSHLAHAANTVRQVLATMPTSEQVRRVGHFQNLWITDLVDQLQVLRGVSRPEPVTIADLPPALATRYHSSGGMWKVEVFAKTSVWDLEPLQHFARQVATVDPHATGKPIATLHSLIQMVHGYYYSSLLAGALIFVTVWLNFREWRAVCLALMPLAFGALLMFGVMGFVDIPLNPANLIALPLILGVGIDYGVHVLHDYRRQSGPYQLSGQLARALLLTSSTTILGFGSLVVARHRGIASIGYILGIGVSGAALGALVFLPVLLRHLNRPGVQSCSENPPSIPPLDSSARLSEDRAA